VIFSPRLTLRLDPTASIDPIPHAHLLRAFFRERFEAAACERVRQSAVAAFDLDEGLFRPGALARDELLFVDDVYVPVRPRRWRLSIGRVNSDELRVEIPIDDDDARALADMIRLGARTEDVDEFRAYAESLGPVALSLLLDRNTRSLHAPAWPDARRAGIHRREHASLLVRSATTTILFDPLLLLRDLPNLTSLPAELAEHIDAVVITHGHGDHFHIPSILASAPDPATPVIVPRVPRTSLLTPFDFAASLQAVGQATIPLGWGEATVIGDIEIRALPFYGEQPTRAGPGAPDGVRNWGNCYRVTTPELSLLVIVDGDDDPAGSMSAVAASSFATDGPVDVVLSCLRTFASPFFGGLHDYWATLRFSRLRELLEQHEASTLPSTTAGPDGTADVCVAAGARWYLPYANGFEGVGGPIRDIGWGSSEPSEDDAVARTSAELTARSAPTRAHSWRPGDAAFKDGGVLRIVRGQADRDVP
jgi:hypothetical protein